MSTSDTPPITTVTEDRTVAILGYITIIGFIVALVLHSSKKTALGSYHLRQCLGLILTFVAMGVIGFLMAFIPFLGWMVMMALWFGLFVLWVMGLLAAANGQQKPVPVLGEHYQKWFAGAFA